MIGAIIGDIVGSRFEFNNHKSKDFELFHPNCKMTDDSIMTLAVMDAILKCDGDYDMLREFTIDSMLRFGKKYPNAGYGRSFKKWLKSDNPKPYNSYGNGAAMRVSPCGWIGRNIDEVRMLSDKVTSISHNHPEGLKGAEVTSLCIYFTKSRNGFDKDCVENIGSCKYNLDFTIDSIRDTYRFNETCQGTVPVAMKAFLESEDFEDALRIAVSVGGDSDTIAAITGGIAGAYYGIPDDIFETAIRYLDDEELSIVLRFYNLVNSQK